MVTLSSVYLPEDLQIVSRDHLANVCLALIRLQEATSNKFGGVQLKPFIGIEFNTSTHFARVSFRCGVNIDEVLSCVPLDAEYTLKLGD